MRRLLIILKNLISLPYRFFFTRISIFSILQETEIDKTAAIALGVKFYRGKIGKYSYINRNSFVTDTIIGDFCSIGSSCEIGGAMHPLNWGSTSPVFHKWENIMKKNFFRHEFEIFSKTNIGNDVWIGTKCIIKAGVKISDGAVIGMGSVVTKDIGPYEIWVGNPARFIRKRFDEEIIESLLNIKWWQLSDEEIQKKAKDINDIEKFLKSFKE